MKQALRSVLCSGTAFDAEEQFIAIVSITTVGSRCMILCGALSSAVPSLNCTIDRLGSHVRGAVTSRYSFRTSRLLDVVEAFTYLTA